MMMRCAFILAKTVFRTALASVIATLLDIFEVILSRRATIEEINNEADLYKQFFLIKCNFFVAYCKTALYCKYDLFYKVQSIVYSIYQAGRAYCKVHITGTYGYINIDKAGDVRGQCQNAFGVAIEAATNGAQGVAFCDDVQVQQPISVGALKIEIYYYCMQGQHFMSDNALHLIAAHCIATFAIALYLSFQ